MMRDLSGLHILVNGERAIEIAQLGDGLGAAAIQLREKDLPVSQILRRADELRRIIQHAAFIINDRADIAKAVGADGMHLGQDDLPIEHARAILGNDAIIGLSTGSVHQAAAAQHAGANYIGFGHMYPTASKRKETPPKSIDELSAIVSAVSIPVIAIGGIAPQNASPILEVASGIAVIGAVQSSDDPRRAIEDLLQIIAQAKACATSLA